MDEEQPPVTAPVADDVQDAAAGNQADGEEGGEAMDVAYDDGNAASAPRSTDSDLAWSRRQLDRSIAAHRARPSSTTSRKDVLHFLGLANGLLTYRAALLALESPPVGPQEATTIGNATEKASSIFAAKDLDAFKRAKQIPLLQLESDPERKKPGTEAHPSIHAWLLKFENAVYGGGAQIDMVWKTHLAVAVGHSQRLIRWFNQDFKDKEMNWEEAKIALQTKFKDETREPRAQQQLANEVAGPEEHPLHWVERFMSIMTHNGIEDSAVYGEFLENSLQKHHKNFCKNIRVSYGAMVGMAAKSKEPRPEFNVQFFLDVGLSVLEGDDLPTAANKKGAAIAAA
ncbi:hypothetical protein BC940DRAFT_324003, partial [Gongronella butleri]